MADEAKLAIVFTYFFLFSFLFFFFFLRLLLFTLFIEGFLKPGSVMDLRPLSGLHGGEESPPGGVSEVVGMVAVDAAEPCSSGENGPEEPCSITEDRVANIMGTVTATLEDERQALKVLEKRGIRRVLDLKDEGDVEMWIRSNNTLAAWKKREDWKLESGALEPGVYIDSLGLLRITPMAD